MKFLLDRCAGHNVSNASDFPTQTPDTEVLRFAAFQKCTIITMDKDSSYLIQVRKLRHAADHTHGILRAVPMFTNLGIPLAESAIPAATSSTLKATPPYSPATSLTGEVR